eukprot:scaffold21283_cov107-Isochrysis_galbana.AAC.3
MRKWPRPCRSGGLPCHTLPGPRAAATHPNRSRWPTTRRPTTMRCSSGQVHHPHATGRWTRPAPRARNAALRQLGARRRRRRVATRPCAPLAAGRPLDGCAQRRPTPGMTSGTHWPTRVFARVRPELACPARRSSLWQPRCPMNEAKRDEREGCDQRLPKGLGGGTAGPPRTTCLGFLF